MIPNKDKGGHRQEGRGHGSGTLSAREPCPLGDTDQSLLWGLQRGWLTALGTSAGVGTPPSSAIDRGWPPRLEPRRVRTTPRVTQASGDPGSAENRVLNSSCI